MPIINNYPIFRYSRYTYPDCYISGFAKKL